MWFSEHLLVDTDYLSVGHCRRLDGFRNYFELNEILQLIIWCNCPIHVSANGIKLHLRMVLLIGAYPPS
jgi:hypothetical protein